LASCQTGEFEPRIVGKQPASSLDMALAEARKDYGLGNFALALENYRRASRLAPNDARALNGLAACYDRMGRFDLSRRYYEQALALAPADSRTLHNFQTSLVMQGRNEEAASLMAAATPSGAGQQLLAEAVSDQPLTLEVDSIRVEAPPLAPLPRLERLSLAEVALLSASESGMIASVSRPQPRVVKVEQAQLVRKTSHSSEWVFPEAAIQPKAAQAAAPAPVRAAPARPQVLVLNGARREGLAARYRVYLKGLGWSDVQVGDAVHKWPASQIMHRTTARESATALAGRIPFTPRLKPKADGTPIVLVLGRDSLRFDDKLRQPRG
jgi:hypothetical protein